MSKPAILTPMQLAEHHKLVYRENPMTNTEVHSRLVHAVTDYDRKQSTKRGYNHYALAQYFAALDVALSHVKSGQTWPNAIHAVFNDRLESFLLRSLPA